MKILILGNSGIFQKKIFDSLKKFKKISVEVASRRDINFDKKIKTYKSYKLSIENTEAKIVYISLVNSEHFKWALYALKKKVRKEAIELVKLHLRENKQKAYEVEDKDLEKIIKKKESRVRQKYWKSFFKYGPLKLILAATGLSLFDD